MENIMVFSNEKTRLRYFLVAGYAILSFLALALLGVKGLIVSIAGLTGLIVTPFIYDKPNWILFAALFLYPLTRLLSVDDKIIITGGLYLVAFPSTIWLLSKYLKNVAKISPQVWALIAYSIIVLLNVFRPDQALMDVVKEFGRSYFALFIIFSIYHYVKSNAENLDKISKYLSYLFNFIALTGIWQFITKQGGFTIEGVYRIRGTFFNFNDYGYALSIFIAFALFMYLFTVKPKEKTYWIFTVGLNLIVLMATFSKTSYLNVGLAFLFMSLFLNWRTRLQIFAGSLILGVILMAFLTFSGAMENILLRFSDNSSLNWRFEMWRNLYNLIQQGNIYIGNGAEAARNYLMLIMPAENSYAPHNVYLETWYNFGLVGLVVFAFTLLLTAFKGLWILLSKHASAIQNRLIGTAICLVVAITLIQSSVGNAFYDRSCNIFFWAIITILVCWYNRGYIGEQTQG